MACEIIRRNKAKLTRLDYMQVLTECGHDDVVYLDPPYLENCDVRAYTDGMLDHQEMVRILKRARFRWVLSEYEHPIYVRAFGAPALKIERQKIIKSNAAGRGKKSHRAVECLWRNF